MKSVKTNSSEVFIGSTIFQKLEELIQNYENNQLFILVDENTLEHCTAELITNVPALQSAEIIEVNSGEENKTLDICYQIWKTLSEFKAGRKSLLLNLGGGVITDMGGFIASTFKRGIDFINLPTTLLSQIDASVGGKVGVDFEGLKNMIGVFNEPVAVFIYPEFLKTLDKRQMLSGYAEALKHALIADKEYWSLLKNGMLSDTGKWGELILRSVEIKNKIVISDPTEKAERKLLNFGHTIGHAIESYSLNNDENPLLHGEAIVIGMICEAYISNQKLELSDNDFQDITETLLQYFTPYQLNEKEFHQLIELMEHDKKNETKAINFTLLSSIGSGCINQEAETDEIIKALNFYMSLNR